MNRLGLYIHWPYCLSKCPYCDFNSYVAQTVDYGQWFEAYKKSLEHYAEQIEIRPLHSIFFGGGTPSLMPADFVESIINLANDIFTFEPDIEITLEANPTSVENRKFQGFKQAGINRVSLGVQALNNEDLQFLGRHHTVDEALEALDIAQKYFDRFSFDLIYARPQQDLKSWEAELKQALSYAESGATHLSLYQLTIEPNTAFYSAYQRGKFTLPDENESADLYELTTALTRQAGLNAYEVSNYAATGAEARHNLIYWQYQDYIGIGPGAHGRLTNKRGDRIATQECRAPNFWQERILQNNEKAREQEILSPHDQFHEQMMMGLRLMEGINLKNWQDFCANEKIDQLINAGDLSIQDNHWRLTSQGRLRLNSVLAHLRE